MENEWIATVQENTTSIYVVINKKQIADKLKIKKGDVVRLKILDIQRSESHE